MNTCHKGTRGKTDVQYVDVCASKREETTGHLVGRSPIDHFNWVHMALQITQPDL